MQFHLGAKSLCNGGPAQMCVTVILMRQLLGSQKSLQYEP